MASCSATSRSISSSPARRRGSRRAQYKLVGTRVPRVDMPDKVDGTYTHMQHVRVANMLHGRVVRPRGQRAYGTRAAPLAVDEASIADIPGRTDRAPRRLRRRGGRERVGRGQRRAAAQGPGRRRRRCRTWRSCRRCCAPRSRPIPLWSTSAIRRRAFGKATYVSSATYFSPYQAHAPFGPNCAIADVGPDEALVLCSTQDIYASRKMLATLLGMPVERVRVQYYEGSAPTAIAATRTRRRPPQSCRRR